MKEWIPENPYKHTDHTKRMCIDCEHTFLEGVSAGQSKLIEWLDEPCVKHPKMIILASITGKNHRRDCPECWNELKEAT